MGKLYFVGMTSAGKTEDLKELIEPIHQYFDGLIWTFHYPKDEGADYLESRKGCGEIIYTNFCKRHGFSRNHYLWAGPATDGDWLVQTDDLERLVPEFAAKIRDMIPDLEENGVNVVTYFGKAFIYKWDESLEFVGSPHEGLTRRDGQANHIELSQAFPDENKVRKNVRPLKRQDKFHWMTHYLRYYIEYPIGSNHCLLGNEHRGNPAQIFQQREQVRYHFRNELRKRGIPLTVAGFKEYLENNKPDEKMTAFINSEKILNDAYRFWSLKDETINDNHHWKDMIKL